MNTKPRRFAQMGIVALLAVGLGGCFGAKEYNPPANVDQESGPDTWGWSRNGTLKIPAIHIGDTYWLEHDVEWRSGTVEQLTLRVRAAPGPIMDRLGNWFVPPAVLEDWRPLESSARFWVLGPHGDIVATLSGSTGQGDTLHSLWSRGELQYGPYGLVQGLQRMLLFLGLAGNVVDAGNLTAWPAYLTTFETYGSVSNAGGRIGSIGQQYYENLGEANLHKEYVEYEFHGAPLPSLVTGRQGVRGDLDDDKPGLLARLISWSPGDGGAVAFGGEPRELVLPKNRSLTVSPLSLSDIPTELGYDEAYQTLSNETEFHEWRSSHRGARMDQATFSWHSSDEQKTSHPGWQFHFVAEDGAILNVLVARHSYETTKPNETLVGQLTGMDDRVTRNRTEIEWMYPRDSNPTRILNVSRIPSTIAPRLAYELATQWAPPNATLTNVRFSITDWNSQYIWPSDWPRELWAGTSRICFGMLVEEDQGLKRWVWIDLATGWFQTVTGIKDHGTCS